MNCPIPFSYEVTQVRANIACLSLDGDLADLAGGAATRFFLGPDAWGKAVRAAQEAREAFHASWADAHEEGAQ